MATKGSDSSEAQFDSGITEAEAQARHERAEKVAHTWNSIVMQVGYDHLERLQHDRIQESLDLDTVDKRASNHVSTSVSNLRDMIDQNDVFDTIPTDLMDSAITAFERSINDGLDDDITFGSIARAGHRLTEEVDREGASTSLRRSMVLSLLEYNQLDFDPTGTKQRKELGGMFLMMPPAEIMSHYIRLGNWFVEERVVELLESREQMVRERQQIEKQATQERRFGVGGPAKSGTFQSVSAAFRELALEAKQRAEAGRKQEEISNEISIPNSESHIPVVGPNPTPVIAPVVEKISQIYSKDVKPENPIAIENNQQEQQSLPASDQRVMNVANDISIIGTLGAIQYADREIHSGSDVPVEVYDQIRVDVRGIGKTDSIYLTADDARDILGTIGVGERVEVRGRLYSDYAQDATRTYVLAFVDEVMLASEKEKDRAVASIRGEVLITPTVEHVNQLGHREVARTEILTAEGYQIHAFGKGDVAISLANNLEKGDQLNVFGILTTSLAENDTLPSIELRIPRITDYTITHSRRNETIPNANNIKNNTIPENNASRSKENQTRQESREVDFDDTPDDISSARPDESSGEQFKSQRSNELNIRPDGSFRAELRGVLESQVTYDETGTFHFNVLIDDGKYQNIFPVSMPYQSIDEANRLLSLSPGSQVFVEGGIQSSEQNIHDRNYLITNVLADHVTIANNRERHFARSELKGTLRENPLVKPHDHKEGKFVRLEVAIDTTNTVGVYGFNAIAGPMGTELKTGMHVNMKGSMLVTPERGSIPPSVHAVAFKYEIARVQTQAHHHSSAESERVIHNQKAESRQEKSSNIPDNKNLTELVGVVVGKPKIVSNPQSKMTEVMFSLKTEGMEGYAAVQKVYGLTSNSNPIIDRIKNGMSVAVTGEYKKKPSEIHAKNKNGAVYETVFKISSIQERSTNLLERSVSPSQVPPQVPPQVRHPISKPKTNLEHSHQYSRLEGLVVGDPQISHGPKMTRLLFYVQTDSHRYPQKVIGFVDHSDRIIHALQNNARFNLTGNYISEPYTSNLGFNKTHNYFQMETMNLVRAKENKKPGVDLSNLSSLPDRAAITTLDMLNPHMAKSMSVAGRSSDGEQVIARFGAMYVGLPKELFSEPPKMHDSLIVSSNAGRTIIDAPSRQVSMER